MDVVADISENEWDAFLTHNPDGTIFQSPAMSHVYRGTRGYRPHVVAALSGGRLTAVLSAAIVSYSRSRPSPMTSRAIVTGGPVGDPAAFAALLGAHDGLAGRAALMTQIRNFRTPPKLAPFESAGYRWEDHLNFVVDLTRGEEAVLAGMSKARRKGISQAERSGFEAHDLGSKDVNRLYALVQETYERARVPLADTSLFRSALEILGPRGNLWAVAAIRDGDVCAVRLCLRWGPTLHDWYAGSSDAGRAVHADEWLVWEILRRGIRSGISTFDFQGAGRPGEPYGPREFKRRFGGEETNPGRFEKVYRPLTLKVSKVAYEIWRRW